METSCIVLAGGKSSRLGYDKVRQTFGGRSLLEQVISRLSWLGSDIIIVTNAGESTAKLVDHPKLRTVADIHPGKGPLGGIYTGLATSTSFYNLVVASDMPFLNQALLRYMMQLSADFDIVVPRVGDLVEPLHAIYTKRCLEPIENMLKQSNLKISQLFPLVKTRYVEASEIERFDPRHLSFFNINTKADLERARELARELEP
ncbi:MAG TPA: molybdenum cofactor guanylyltransferase [Dehalococcoidia bacterium]|nr:molybdenum cofactor guanylyltransferase [Dehalococcoidia bacterium]